MARVEVKNVVKRFGKVTAVNGVSLVVEDGEFFTILGPSGCGKTTLLRIIAGLEIPDEGDVIIDGKVVTNLHPRDRDVAMVFQNYALYPHMTVFENIAFPLRTRKKELGLSEDDIKRMVKSTAEFLGIADLLDRYPSQLSGGQQQRVALARALVRKPKVWLLDEPLSNLDAKLRVLMRSELKKIQRSLGVTTVYVTHDQVEAMAMSDKIAVMNKGVVLQVGRPDDLYYKPVDTFVATFIGSPPMNLLPCTLERVSAREYVVPEEFANGLAGTGKVVSEYLIKCAGGLEIPVDPSFSQKIVEKDIWEVYLGIRPEHIYVYRTPPGINIGVLKTRIELIQPLGSELLLDIKLGDDLIKVRRPPNERYEVGEEVFIVPDLKFTLVFDRRTGKLVI